MLLGFSAALDTTASSVDSQYDSLALLQVVSVFGMWGWRSYRLGRFRANALWQADFSLKATKWAVASVHRRSWPRLGCSAASGRISRRREATIVKAATVTIDRDLFEATA